MTRDLETGRQSTKTLFRNPAELREAKPGDRVRTRIASPEQKLDFEVSVSDSLGTVQRVRVVCELVGEGGRKVENVEFTLERLQQEE